MEGTTVCLGEVNRSEDKMKYRELFFQLLRNELWREGAVPDALTFEEFAYVHEMAREQTVAGLVSNAIARNGVRTGDDNAMRVMAVKVNHDRRAEKMQGALKALINCLDASHMNYVVFKGQTVAALYPEPFMRTLGDLDFYCLPEDGECARKAIEQALGVTVHIDELEKHHTFEYDGIRFEMHYRMETFGTSRHQHYFDTLITQGMNKLSAMQIGDANVKTLSPMLAVLVCFKHLFNHFLIEGVGLRQVCDMAILFGRYQGKIDANELRLHLEEMGYLKAFKAVGGITVKHLGLPERAFPFPLSKNDFRWADRMLKEILKHGNFGKYHRNHMTEGTSKSLETARIAFSHCARFLPLAPKEILCLTPRRMRISMRKRHS